MLCSRSLNGNCRNHDSDGGDLNIRLHKKCNKNFCFRHAAANWWSCTRCQDN